MYKVDDRLYSTRTFWPYPGQRCTFYDGVDSVYTFRTGRRAGGGRGVTNITIPDFSSMPTGSKVSALGAFYRDFSESVSASSAAAADEGSNRSLTGDTGHEFFRVRSRTTPFVVHVLRKDNGVWLDADVPVYPGELGIFPALQSPSPYQRWQALRAQTPKGRAVVEGSVSDVTPDPQSQLNYLFSQMRTHKPVANVAESIVEILRGGVPALLGGTLEAWNGLLRTVPKNRLRTRDLVDPKKMASIAKSDLRYAGSTYLGYQFGLTPLIGDVLKIVDNLTTLHTLVYGTSERYRRKLPLISESKTLSSRRTNTVAAARRADSGLSIGLPSTPTEVSVVRSYDTRLTARIGGLARPNTVHNGFLERADNLLYNLGFKEPELIWNLTSFSWLLDWYTHLGTSIANAYRLSGNGVNVDYAYSTVSFKTLITQKHAGLAFANDTTGVFPGEGYTKRYADVLYRRRATPFGFGGDLSSLSSGQMSILVALGLAKS